MWWTSVMDADLSKSGERVWERPLFAFLSYNSYVAMWKEEKVINGHDTAVNCKRKENESCCFPTCSFILVIQICNFFFPIYGTDWTCHGWLTQQRTCASAKNGRSSITDAITFSWRLFPYFIKGRSSKNIVNFSMKSQTFHSRTPFMENLLASLYFPIIDPNIRM